MAVNTTNIKFNQTFPFSVSSNQRYCYIYQATSGGTSYGSNIAASSAYDYFPNSPTADDAIYFGFRTGSNPFTIPSKWRDLVFEVGTALDGTPTLVWEYWDSSSWSTLTVTNGNAFTSTGTQTVTFTPPADWYSLNPTNGGTPTDSNSGLFVRCRMSVTTGVTEGGANATNVTRMATNAIQVVDNVGGTAVTFEDMYDTAVNQSWACSPAKQECADGGYQSFYFNCNVVMGANSPETGGAKSGYLDWGNSVVTLENNCRFDSTNYASVLEAGTNVEDAMGVARPTLRTNQTFRSRSLCYIKGVFNVFGFTWENAWIGATPDKSTGSNKWEVRVFGRETTTANGAELIDCTFAGFRFFSYSCNRTDGVVRNCQITGCEGQNTSQSATFDEIRLFDMYRGIRGEGSVDFTVSNAVYSNISLFKFHTWALVATARIRNSVGILPYTTSTACTWGNAATNTGAFWMQFSIDLTVVDQSGVAISGATVTLSPDGSDENENNFSTSTAGDGTITTQWVTKETLEYGGASTTTTITNYDDFTLTISAAGYQDVDMVFSLDEAEDFLVAMLPTVAASGGTGGLNVHTDNLVKL